MLFGVVFVARCRWMSRGCRLGCVLRVGWGGFCRWKNMVAGQACNDDCYVKSGEEMLVFGVV